jgi:hypothetical protein
MRRGREGIAVGLLLAAHAALAFTSLRTKSLTFDESAYLVGGASYWAYGDYRLNPEAGALPQRWAALPLALAGHAPPDRSDPAWADADPWRLGNRWLYHSSLPTGEVVRRARGMMVWLSLAFAGLVFVAARALWGPSGALVSLAAYAFSPTLLAHARLATSDLAAAGFLLAATFAVWRLARRVTPARVFASALAIAALLLSKYSGLVIAPMAVLVVAGVAAARRATPWCCAGGLRGRARGWARALPLALAALAVILAVWALVWGAYGLRFAMTAEPDAVAHPFRPWSQVLSAGGAQAKVIAAAREARVLPEAFLYGWAHAVYAGQQRRSFLLGEHSLSGFRSFFPVLFGAKTSPALFALLAVAVAALLLMPRRRRGALLARALPLGVLIAVYAAAALASRLNIGHRHLLPVELAMIVLLGASGWRLARASRVRRGLVVVALTGLALEALHIWPDYLAYWSPLAGGPVRGYRIAVDSSLDWGQDLARLGEELAGRRERGESGPIYLAYFGTASPLHHQVTARRLTSYLTYDWDRPDPRPLAGGTYWISATQLQNLYTRAPGHWTRDYEWRYQLLRGLVQALLAADDETRAALARSVGGEAELERSQALYCDLRFARLAAFLRQREPDRRFGYSIHEYRLSDEQVREWLEGPPPPLRARSGYEQDPALALGR